MAGAVGKYAANKMLKKQMAQYKSKKVAGDDDPYFALIDDPRKPGKQKKVKKVVPAYIPEHDANVLAKMRRRSYRLDMALFEFAGTRFGWSSVLGIVPAFGDAADAAIALMLVRGCMKVEGGLPAAILLQMLINVALDFGIGLVPILGDFADAYFKANTRNCRLLEKHLDSRHKPDALKMNRKNDKFVPPATAYEDFSDEEDERRAFVQSTNGPNDTRRPQPAVDPNTRKAGKTGGWFSRGGGGQRERDMERGEAPAHLYRPGDVQETGTVHSGR